MYLTRHPEAAFFRNQNGETLLLMAARYDRIDFLEVGWEWCKTFILQDLFSRGVDIDAADNQGCTPLHHAAAWGNIDAAALLLTRGCQFSTINKRGWTAVDYSYTPELAAHIRKLAHATYHERSTQKKNVPVMTGFTSS